MGYKMPIVCKEVYLPVDSAFLSAEPSIEDYRKKYGIDLNDVISIEADVEQDEVTVKIKNNIKLFLVFIDYPLPIQTPNNNKISGIDDGEAILSFSDINKNLGAGFRFVLNNEHKITNIEFWEA